MVRHVTPTRSYWTLPSGGVNAGEAPAEAAAREVREETGMRTRAIRLLFESTYGDFDSPESYSLMPLDVDGAADASLPAIALGADPEEAHLPPPERLPQGAEWKSLDEMRIDPQVSAVLRALANDRSVR